MVNSLNRRWGLVHHPNSGSAGSCHYWSLTNKLCDYRVLKIICHSWVHNWLQLVSTRPLCKVLPFLALLSSLHHDPWSRWEHVLSTSCTWTIQDYCLRPVSTFVRQPLRLVDVQQFSLTAKVLSEFLSSWFRMYPRRICSYNLRFASAQDASLVFIWSASVFATYCCRLVRNHKISIFHEVWIPKF